jgi:thiamine pyrophosphate-dependent acetolactate synthase large subunit-like protein
MTQTLGHRRLLEQLKADDVHVLFGNPGTTEEGLLDELSHFPDISYVMGLQKAALVCIADGYAQATQQPARETLNWRKPTEVLDNLLTQHVSP